MQKRTRNLILFGLIAPPLVVSAMAWFWLQHLVASHQPDDAFEEEIRRFEQLDAQRGGGERPILFTGSSSIRLWDSLEADMAPLAVLGRGYGGSQLSHAIHNVHRIVTPLRPRAVLVYAGDNDMAEPANKSAQRVVADFRRLCEEIHSKVPDARIYFLAIKPSERRWDRWPEMQKANHAIAQFTRNDDRLDYLDVATPLLDAQGRPDDELYLMDELHLSEAGYEIWTRIVRQALLRDFGDP